MYGFYNQAVHKVETELKGSISVIIANQLAIASYTCRVMQCPHAHTETKTYQLNPTNHAKTIIASSKNFKPCLHTNYKACETFVALSNTPTICIV